MSNPETALARSPLAAVTALSTPAAAGNPCGVLLEEIPAGVTLQIIARQGKAEAVRAALRTATGLDAPTTPARVAKDGVALVWSGPAQWLLMLDAAAAPAIADKFAAALAGHASISDQSDARVHLRLSGPHVRSALEKLVGIDVHPDAFVPGAAAMTAIADMAVHLWRLPDASNGAAFVIAGAQSTAISLWHHVVTAAEEYGLDARRV